MKAMQRWLKIAFALGLTGLLTPVAFYSAFEYAANRIVKDYALPIQTRNAIKHSYTAATLYTLFRSAHIDDNHAERWTLLLGIINEKIETYTKIGSPDSYAEIQKDLSNNWSGLVAARWRRDHASDISLARTIAMLAKDRILVVDAAPIQGTAVLDRERLIRAREWFLHHQEEMAQKVMNALDQYFDKH